MGYAQKEIFNGMQKLYILRTEEVLLFLIFTLFLTDTEYE